MACGSCSKKKAQAAKAVPVTMKDGIVTIAGKKYRLKKTTIKTNDKPRSSGSGGTSSS